jgi:hypothetical protein
MKRQYVIPDLLASLTADALFAGTRRRDQRALADPTKPTPMERLSRWFKRAPDAALDSAQRAPARDTLTDDWAGGWYARTRLLQATTLAQHAANSGATTGQDAGIDASAVDAKAAS